jgi:hypothetical protein
MSRDPITVELVQPFGAQPEDPPKHLDVVLSEVSCRTRAGQCGVSEPERLLEIVSRADLRPILHQEELPLPQVLVGEEVPTVHH